MKLMPTAIHTWRLCTLIPQASIAKGPIVLYVSAFLSSLVTKGLNRIIGLKVSHTVYTLLRVQFFNSQLLSCFQDAICIVSGFSFDVNVSSISTHKYCICIT